MSQYDRFMLGSNYFKVVWLVCSWYLLQCWSMHVRSLTYLFYFPYFQQLLEAKDKHKAKTRTLPYLPLPVVDSNATRTILSYNQNSQKNTTTNSNPSTPKDGLQDPFGLSLFGETETKSNPDNVILIGQASFEEKYDMELEKRWKDLEEESYESVNITPVPPSFRTHVHCLSSKTTNKIKPLCVINGRYSYKFILN